MSLALVAALLSARRPLGAATAPKVSLRTARELPVVERYPYDEHANADAAVAAAFARARKSHKRVLIDLGGNWCGDCVVLANVMQLPEMKPFLAAHYEIVSVDVGRFNKNLQIPARFGITKRLVGVPSAPDRRAGRQDAGRCGTCLRARRCAAHDAAGSRRLARQVGEVKGTE